jgi:S1-C subfamily serine protease
MGFPIGGALGFSPVTHRGMVSSIAAVALPSPSARQLNQQAIRSLRGDGRFDIFQLDGTAYPGNSGGPLFDPETGDVLGVINMVFIKGTRESALTNPSGITYAIPSAHILQLLQRGKVNQLSR